MLWVIKYRKNKACRCSYGIPFFSFLGKICPTVAGRSLKGPSILRASPRQLCCKVSHSIGPGASSKRTFLVT
jgi:hypothetical protein